MIIETEKRKRAEQGPSSAPEPNSPISRSKRRSTRQQFVCPEPSEIELSDNPPVRKVFLQYIERVLLRDIHNRHPPAVGQVLG